ncbi:hypothetical protein K438DRAFT_2010076 [Mycena galopus ATCC 62051]|nr:hypothetical protein K438DRAFT_2010076 [Mycena galopus ATCC 62051]
MASISTAQPINNATAATSTTVNEPTQAAATSPDQTATEAPVEHKKHGIGAIIEKIVHPIHGSGHTHLETDTPSVPVAVPETASDGPARVLPAGAPGGLL